jgi:hypothetical protein
MKQLELNVQQIMIEKLFAHPFNAKHASWLRNQFTTFEDTWRSVQFEI